MHLRCNIILFFSIFVFVSSCVNVQKKDAKFLANKTATFKNIHNTNLEFLSYISVSKDYSYIIDSPLIVVRIIFPDTTLMTIKGITSPVTFDLTTTANSASTKFMVDRTKYDIKYGSGTFFSSIGDKAIADEFELDVTLKF